MTTDAGGIVGEFLSLKESTDADVLAMQCGDFYEFFADDAELVADELDLKVSQKSSHGSSYPMAGVPLSELTPYLKALVERGYRVAVAEQYETDDGHAREIERVVSPGTVVDPDGAEARYLAAVEHDASGDADGDDSWGVAFAEVTTGRFHAAAFAELDDVRAELHRFAPVELLPGPGVRDDDARLADLRESTDARLTLHEAEAFAPGRARHRLGEQFGGQALAAVGLDADPAVAAAGAVLHYVDETGAGVLASMTRLGGLDAGGRVALDATTQRNLELVETMQGESTGTLLDTLDHTETAAGTRLLREWLTRPQRDRAELERRGKAVEAFASAALARDRLLDTLDGTADLERLAARATSGSAGPRDLVAVRSALERLPELAAAIDGTALADSPVPDVLARPDQGAARDLHDELAEALAEEPPGSIGGDGGVIARGYDEELDELVTEYDEAVDWLDTLAEREKRQHGLSHVSVDRNKTDGYYVQVGKSVAGQVPDHYREIKTLKNSKRFVTEELEERERTVLRMEERREELERRIFEEVRDRVAEEAELLQDVGRALAELDVLAALGHHAATNDWTRPEFTDGDELRIEAGRHPVVEQTTDFVPNDLHMDRERGFLIVTGPNMSGKSTYMRQCALIALLAQTGSFVPADAATLPLVDGVYTRVGALDELAQGRSTFMVEMQELSNILHSATEDSLVILDEVGRGTATYDGISIAWAATEYLHNEVRAKTLFATHYHELTALAEHLPRVANVHVAAEERDGDVTFLRRVREGPTDRSYGVHVADLAGVPDPVVGRADEVLDRLREEKAIEAKGGGGGGDSVGGAETKQVVFDLSAGEFAADAGGSNGNRPDAPAGNGPAVATAEAGGEAPGDAEPATEPAAAEPTDAGIDPAIEDVLAALRETNVNETPPVELMARVQEWQEQLDADEE